MALVSVPNELPCKGHVLQNETLTRQSKGELLFEANGSRRFSPVRISTYRSCHIPYPAFDMLMKTEVTRRSALQYGTMLSGMCMTTSHIRSLPFRLSPREKLYLVRASSDPDVTKERLRLLDSYFGKLQGRGGNLSSESCNSMGEEKDQKVEIYAEEELKSLDASLGKFRNDTSLEDSVSSTLDDQESHGSSAAKPLSKFRNTDTKSSPCRSQALQQLDDDQYAKASNFYVVSILASINVGVCLFEVATPVKNNDLGLFSLPLLYGAKINDLIMVGEWWRLVTPMFLHSGILHVALSCWALLTFGPQVCRGYGQFTFFLIYILGGISGNFMSFLHTPDPMVGGTGPAFALIGAWLVYQMQNKDMIEKNASEDLFQKAIIITGLGLILSHFGPIDDWTHLGAILAGVGYGFFTCPLLQLGESSSRTGQEEGIAVARPNADPCKSFLVFAIFVAVLVTFLLVFIEGPFEVPLSDDIVYSLI